MSICFADNRMECFWGFYTLDNTSRNAVYLSYHFPWKFFWHVLDSTGIGAPLDFVLIFLWVNFSLELSDVLCLAFSQSSTYFFFSCCFIFDWFSSIVVRFQLILWDSYCFDITLSLLLTNWLWLFAYRNASYKPSGLSFFDCSFYQWLNVQVLCLSLKETVQVLLYRGYVLCVPWCIQFLFAKLNMDLFNCAFVKVVYKVGVQIE